MLKSIRNGIRVRFGHFYLSCASCGVDISNRKKITEATRFCAKHEKTEMPAEQYLKIQKWFKERNEENRKDAEKALNNCQIKDGLFCGWIIWQTIPRKNFEIGWKQN